MVEPESSIAAAFFAGRTAAASKQARTSNPNSIGSETFLSWRGGYDGQVRDDKRALYLDDPYTEVGYDGVLRDIKTIEITQAQVYSLFSVPIVVLRGLVDKISVIDKYQFYRIPGTPYAGAFGDIEIRFGVAAHATMSGASTIGASPTPHILTSFGLPSTELLGIDAGKAWDVRLSVGNPTPASGTNGFKLRLWCSVWSLVL